MRYFLGFLGAVALVVLVFILIVRGLGGDDGSKIQTQLTDYSKTETVMRLRINGPVDAEQTHRHLTLTVGRNQNTFQLFQGYGDNEIKAQSYPNSEEGYRTFLRALQLQGYLKGNDDPKKADYEGVCPTGRIFIFEIITGSATVQRFWTSSCGGGTFGGNTALIRQLFRAQIPDFSKLSTGTGLQ